MLSALNNITLLRNNYKNKAEYSKYTVSKPVLNTLTCDTVRFTGKSMPSEYETVFEYMAAEILGKNKRVNAGMLSKTKIGKAVEELYEKNEIFTDFKQSCVEKIKWKSYIPEDVRIYSIDKINKAREVRLKEWLDFLEDTSVSETGTRHDPELVDKIKNNKPLKLVIWDAVTSEIKDNNRHIPVPFNEKALLETIKRFERYDAKDRATSCSKPSFIEIYTHKLRDNLLMDMGLSNNTAVWIKIPSIKHDPKNRNKNIQNLEILSCKNWCTRSSVDKAEDALLDGDFYIYLKRNSFKLWEPQIGMTTCGGKIDQIQGIENNNIIPLNLIDEVKRYISENGLKCASGLYDEGPKAYQAIMISEKLNEQNRLNKKTFFKAIKDNDDMAMFEFLNIKTETLPDGSIKIEKYKPSYQMQTGSGITIPYSMFGIDEDSILKNVSIIDGNFILHNKNALFDSKITIFPQKLQEVKGKIICSAQQYEKFKDDINRVIGNDTNKLIIRN